jgi:hypothetical protein
VGEVWVVVLMTRLELEHVSDTAEEQKPGIKEGRGEKVMAGTMRGSEGG